VKCSESLSGVHNVKQFNSENKNSKTFYISHSMSIVMQYKSDLFKF